MDLSAIYELIEKTKSDSKKESIDAKCELIDICEPIIKEYCVAVENCIVKINKDCKVDGDYEIRQKYFDPNYQYNQGSIEDFIGYYDRKLLFLYRDFCWGNEFACNVSMPMEWLDKDKFDDNMKVIKKDIYNKQIRVLNDKIAKCAKDLDKLRKQLEMIEEIA